MQLAGFILKHLTEKEDHLVWSNCRLQHDGDNGKMDRNNFMSSEQTYGASDYVLLYFLLFYFPSCFLIFLNFYSFFVLSFYTRVNQELKVLDDNTEGLAEID
jgi:hypothetical protein